MASASNRWNIVGGPSKYDLLIHGFCERNSVSFTTTYNQERALVCILNECKYEDGSGNNFLLAGFISNFPEGQWSFKAYYNVQRRTGWLEFQRVQ